MALGVAVAGKNGAGLRCNGTWCGYGGDERRRLQMQWHLVWLWRGQTASAVDEMTLGGLWQERTTPSSHVMALGVAVARTNGAGCK